MNFSLYGAIPQQSGGSFDLNGFLSQSNLESLAPSLSGFSGGSSSGIGSSIANMAGSFLGPVGGLLSGFVGKGLDDLFGSKTSKETFVNNGSAAISKVVSDNQAKYPNDVSALLTGLSKDLNFLLIVTNQRLANSSSARTINGHTENVANVTKALASVDDLERGLKADFDVLKQSVSFNYPQKYLSHYVAMRPATSNYNKYTVTPKSLVSSFSNNQTVMDVNGNPVIQKTINWQKILFVFFLPVIAVGYGVYLLIKKFKK